MKLTNSYADLGDAFCQKIKPTPVRHPQLFLWNSALAEQLGIPGELENDAAALAQHFSGNRLLPGSEPVATAYAGHQFGQFVPQLGDGRAHLIGEVLDQSGKRRDIQLKGSGRTAFSRGGDGRCALGPAVREFMMSEALNALGVPTTRCLAVVATGEPVYREAPQQGAVVSRVASSHIRIGTFQYFAARGDMDALKTLFDYTIARHYPELASEGEPPCVPFINAVMEKQIQLVVDWMRIGFIHGVLNTDNTSIAGETIDYGPCAMMGTYDPRTVYSSIDTMGRYAFGNQPAILQWNIARLAECLLPLIGGDAEKAVEKVRPPISEFSARFEKEFNKMMGKKLGLTSILPDDEKLINSVLQRLKEGQHDYTVAFDLLTNSFTSESSAARVRDELGDVFDRWQKRLQEQQAPPGEIQRLMRSANPVVIPRNHHVEQVIRACEQTGTADAAERFLDVLRTPYEASAQTRHYQDPPKDGDKGYKTFCGT